MGNKPFFVIFSGFQKKIHVICGYWQHHDHKTGQLYVTLHLKILKRRLKISILTQKQRLPFGSFPQPPKAGRCPSWAQVHGPQARAGNTPTHPAPWSQPSPTSSPSLTSHPNGLTVAFAGGAKYKTLLRSSCQS